MNSIEQAPPRRPKLITNCWLCSCGIVMNTYIRVEDTMRIFLCATCAQEWDLDNEPRAVYLARWGN